LPTPPLDADDPAPAIHEDWGGAAPYLMACDHAGRAIPRRLGRLGLGEAALDTHIAWDIGALGLARRLAASLGGGLIHQTYSRLVIDCNRAADHPGSIVAVSDGVFVPGNQGLAPEAAAARRRAIFDPYHARIGAELDARRARGEETLLVCVHSFTPVMDGLARPWHVGVLHDGGSPASHALLALLRAEPELVVGDNQPYAMDGTDFTAPWQAGPRGLDVVELEVRQDLLLESPSAARIAAVLARALPLARGAAAVRPGRHAPGEKVSKKS
jgi:predicted N-formylglutamate amidohydrolase